MVFMGYRNQRAGKSTFLKIISGEMDPTSGHVHLETGKRMSVLSQNHNMFDEHTVLETVIMGNKTFIKKGNGRALFRL
jgi:ATPase subunit of ABC transporter with duplicated ATPase domains